MRLWTSVEPPYFYSIAMIMYFGTLEDIDTTTSHIIMPNLSLTQALDQPPNIIKRGTW